MSSATLSSTTVTKISTGSPLATLQARISGQVFFPGQPEYEQARMGYNTAIDQHPLLIVKAARAEDVSAAVQYAASAGLGVAVQSTGHGVILPADGCLLIQTAALNSRTINSQARTATLGAGLRWGEVLSESQKSGLAPLLGSSPTVGVIGYTLGGGYGWLGRKHGMAADSVLSFELVDARGQILRASPDENSELYWGLRGGGGGFGVITAMTIRLYPVDMVYGGNLIYPAEFAAEVMRRYREWILDAPEALTSSLVLLNFPPIPEVPEFLRGKSVVMVRGCYAGALEEGEALVNEWRAWKTPLIDDFKAMPFSQVASISSDPVDPAPTQHTGAWMHWLSDESIAALIHYTLPQGGPPVIAMTEVRHAGGAVTRGGEHPAAFTNREAELLLFCVGMAPSPEALAHLQAHTDAMKQALAADLTGGLYLNFAAGHEARTRTRDGYSPQAYARLRALKTAADPANLFRCSYDFSNKG